MIKPDYSKITDLFLAYPYGFDKYYHSFTPFFDELISLVPDDIHLYPIVNNRKATQRLHELFPNKNIEVVEIKGFYEIWLRDIMGLNCGEYIIKPIFKPDYYKDVYTIGYLEKIDKQVRNIIATTIRKEIIDIPLIWDCGNLITNGEVSFITDKILRDNKSLTKAEVVAIIKKYTNTEPIIIPTSKYDKLGHFDGYISFLNKETVCLASYPLDDSLSEDNLYILKLKQEIISRGFKIVNSIEKTEIDKSREGKDFIYSAKGCYVNMLLLNDLVILPNYTFLNNKENILLNELNSNIIGNYFEDAKSVNCDLIAKDGGVLRCLSFTN